MEERKGSKGEGKKEGNKKDLQELKDISLKRSENGTTLPPHNTNDKKKSGSLRCCASSTMPAT